MRSVGLIEMNGIKKLNFIEVHTCKKNNFLLINKYEIIFFQLLVLSKSYFNFVYKYFSVLINVIYVLIVIK